MYEIQKFSENNNEQHLNKAANKIKHITNIKTLLKYITYKIKQINAI